LGARAIAEKVDCPRNSEKFWDELLGQALRIVSIREKGGRTMFELLAALGVLGVLLAVGVVVGIVAVALKLSIGIIKLFFGLVAAIVAGVLALVFIIPVGLALLPVLILIGVGLLLLTPFILLLKLVI
jgi:hypothetical protein